MPETSGRPDMKNAPAGDEFLAGGGDMGAYMRSMDWSETLLGPTAEWPQSLRTIVSTCLNSRFPMWIGWGPELAMLYNDAYRPILGDKHPRSMGAPVQEVWGEIWNVIGPLLEGVLERGEATWSEDQLLIVNRHGYLEETYFTFSYSAIRDERGGVGGMLCAVAETTDRVLGERRMRTLRELGERTGGTKEVDAAGAAAVRALGENPADIPFALLYLLDADGREARLAGATGLTVGTPASPARVPLTASEEEPEGWPLARVARAGESEMVEDLGALFGTLPGGAWAEPPDSALVLPVARPGQESPYGLLVTAVNPHRELTDDYHGFFDLVVRHVATAVGNARAYEEETKRAESLAELDRAKTAFFSNVSHELRTPLTLLLGPVQDGLADEREPLPPGQRQRQELVHRNALRLIKLVNALLDFSRIEAGRIEASYQPTDVAAFTADLASMFRSAVENAGLDLVVDTPPLTEPVYVDREMWEKIVLNLLSNALKFTFDGEIRVSVSQADGHVELRVTDTGVGVPDEELPHLFERFHRVKGARSRTHEGTGIGLALVRELTHLHGGEVWVESTEGVGSTFGVSVPLGRAHLPADRIESERELISTDMGSAPYVEEALSWSRNAPSDISPMREPGTAGPDPSLDEQSPTIEPEAASDGARARILLADDNADMRDYVRRLLSTRYEVEAVADGAAALTAARRRAPALVLADVMMPVLDGFDLLRELRDDPATRDIPVVLLSARAGEEARVEGLEAGADDYLIKPFSARELLARVSGHLEIARSRHDAARRERERVAELQSANERLLLAGVRKQEQAEESERHSAELDALLDSMSDAVAVVDADGGIVTMNPAGRSIFHLPTEEELWAMDDERRAFLLNLDGTRIPLDRWPLSRAARGERFDDDEALVVHPDGSRRRVVFSGSQIRDETGKPALAIVVFRDVTELREAEAMKDQLISLISHDLRAPLNAILGYADLLRAQLGEEEREQETRFADSIMRSVKTMEAMIQDLLESTRLESDKPELHKRRCDLRVLVSDAIKHLISPENQARIEVVSPEPLPAIDVDPQRLDRALMNILSNALKYSSPDAPVTVRLERRDGEVVVSVTDRGVGISKEDLPHIFDRFYRAKSGAKAEGFGLGLYITRLIVEAHGGRIWAESEPGGGSTFAFALPIA